MCKGLTIEFVIDCRDINGFKEYDVHLSDQSRVWLQLEAVTQNKGGASAIHAYSSALVHAQKKRETTQGRAQRSDKHCVMRIYRDCTMGGALSRYQLPNVSDEGLLAELATVTALTLDCQTMYITSIHTARNMEENQIRAHGLLVDRCQTVREEGHHRTVDLGCRWCDGRPWEIRNRGGAQRQLGPPLWLEGGTMSKARSRPLFNA
jgi:hypothetical protein